MAQYDQLLLFYDQLLTMADEVKELIDKELFDDILTKMQTHERVFIQIKLAKKCANLTVAEQAEIDKIEEKLREKEKSNIDKLQSNMAKVKQELDRLKMRSKVSTAYAQSSQNIEQGSIIDIDDSYRPN